MINPMIGMPGTPEMLIILAIVILVFGASKLPDLARSSGQALRIFKTETKGLRDGDKDGTVDDAKATPEQREIEARELDARTETRSETTGDVVRERRDDTTA